MKTKKLSPTGGSLCNAFSLTEMLMTLLIVSLLLTAMAPVMTKKSKDSLSVSGRKNYAILAYGDANCPAPSNTALDAGNASCSGNFLVPDGATELTVTLIGAGGGGGGSAISGFREYTTPGDSSFVVPRRVGQVEATLIGGGAGGGRGGYIKSNITFTDSTTWWVKPEALKGQWVLVSGCGAGGGGSTTGCCGATASGGNGGWAFDVPYYVQPEASTVLVTVGRGGGYGAGCGLGGTYAASTGGAPTGTVDLLRVVGGGGGGCSNPSAGYPNGVPPTNGGAAGGTAIFPNCGATRAMDPANPWPLGGGGAPMATGVQGCTMDGGVGVWQYATGGGGGGAVSPAGTASNGGSGGGGATSVGDYYVGALSFGGGGGAGGTASGGGGGGGGGTMGGGGGGGAGHAGINSAGGAGGTAIAGSGGTSGSAGGMGFAGAGGNGGWGRTGVNSTVVTRGGASHAWQDGILPANRCRGGAPGQNGQNGAIFISYLEFGTGGSGGGAGWIQARQRVNVTANETLNTRVGRGGTGTAKAEVIPDTDVFNPPADDVNNGYPGANFRTGLFRGATLLLGNQGTIVGWGACSGMSTGTVHDWGNCHAGRGAIFHGDGTSITASGGPSASYGGFTNWAGRSAGDAAQLVAGGFNPTGNANHRLGGRGGQLATPWFSCTPGAGGTLASPNGGNGSGYGCGGGGGYALGAGGNGSGGYVRIEYNRELAGYGGGGASGYKLEKIKLPVTAGQVIPYTVGAGGLAGTETTNGRQGGMTTFSQGATLMRVGGGFGGNSPTLSGTTIVNGTAGAMANICTLNNANAAICKGSTAGGAPSGTNGGRGANSSEGSGGANGSFESNNTSPSALSSGKAAPALGSGGGGAAVYERTASTTSYEYPQGGRGGHGVIIVEWK